MYRFGEMYQNLGNIQKDPKLGTMMPFKIFGSTYFIGTYQASSHLIDTGDGLIMIDTGYANTGYLVLNSIYRLGFEPKDVKYIINTHWHDDHVGATASFASVTGAKTMIGEYDFEKASRYFKPDMLIKEGDVLSLGNKSIRFMHTPGHTAGTVSLFYDDTDGVNTYRVGMFGGAGLNTLAPGKFDFDGCREAYFASLERLKGERVDIFIGNHTWNNDTLGKYKALTRGVNEFIDCKLWGAFLDDYKRRLEELIRKEKLSTE